MGPRGSTGSAGVRPNGARGSCGGQIGTGVLKVSSGCRSRAARGDGGLMDLDWPPAGEEETLATYARLAPFYDLLFGDLPDDAAFYRAQAAALAGDEPIRSEERRVGEEGRLRW